MIEYEPSKIGNRKSKIETLTLVPGVAALMRY